MIPENKNWQWIEYIEKSRLENRKAQNWSDWVYASLESILVWWAQWCCASLTQVHFILILSKWWHGNACLSMRFLSTVGLCCVIVCWSETCFSSCIISWLQVSPPLVISSDLTHKRSQKHTHIQDGTKDGGNKKMRASRPFTCLRCRYEPISLICDSPHATLSLFRAMFSHSFLLERWDLDLVYIHGWSNLPRNCYQMETCLNVHT